MRLLVLPVSGGKFVSQLAILQHLSAINYVPDLTLASSGGNVSIYIAAAANWKWSKIELIARELSQDLFIKPWSNVAWISMMLGYFKGNLYDNGKGVYHILNKYFTKESIIKHEIWTGTYNKDRQKIRLFCNKSKETSIINTDLIDYDLTQSMPPFFCDGDLEKISTASMASASIPSVVPAQKIENELYVDGGVAGASPLSMMQESILSIVNKDSAPLHIMYVNSVDLSAISNDNIKNVVDTWIQTIDDLIRATTVIDRLAGYELLRSCNGNGDVHKTDFVCNYNNLSKLQTIYDKVKYTMMEIYPTKQYEINIVNFKTDDMIRAIDQAYINTRCRFWWLSVNKTVDKEMLAFIETMEK
jgi:hypothetical protein